MPRPGHECSRGAHPGFNRGTGDDRGARAGPDLGVFHNRLAIGMALGSCATVNYLLPEVKEVLSELDTKIDSPYNTYQTRDCRRDHAAPGEAAIEAALYPAETDYLYFRTKRTVR